jgi:uncharacterized protein YbdZ (MbtH family)
MNTQDQNQNPADNSAYNPFPEPQTIPSGWDTSGFFTSQSASAEEPSDSAESESE